VRFLSGFGECRDDRLAAQLPTGLSGLRPSLLALTAVLFVMVSEC